MQVRTRRWRNRQTHQAQTLVDAGSNPALRPKMFGRCGGTGRHTCPRRMRSIQRLLAGSTPAIGIPARESGANGRRTKLKPSTLESSNLSSRILQRHTRRAGVVQLADTASLNLAAWRFESAHRHPRCHPTFHGPFVQRSGRWPFKPETRVRVSHGLLTKLSVRRSSQEWTFPCHGKERGFKSRTHRFCVGYSSTGRAPRCDRGGCRVRIPLADLKDSDK